MNPSHPTYADTIYTLRKSLALDDFLFSIEARRGGPSTIPTYHSHVEDIVVWQYFNIRSALLSSILQYLSSYSRILLHASNTAIAKDSIDTALGARIVWNDVY